MPLLRKRHDLTVGEFAHLVADGIERVVEPGGADRCVVLLAHQFREPRAALRGIAVSDQMLDRRVQPRRHRGRRKPQIRQPDDLALAHRNAADDLRQIFAGADADQKLLDLAEIVRRRKPSRIGRELPQRFGVGCEPGQTMGGALLAVERTRIGLAIPHDLLGDRPPGVGKQPFDGTGGLLQRLDQLAVGGHGRGGKRHSGLR
jgi:hypothetical protein